MWCNYQLMVISGYRRVAKATLDVSVFAVVFSMMNEIWYNISGINGNVASYWSDHIPERP